MLLSTLNIYHTSKHKSKKKGRKKKEHTHSNKKLQVLVNKKHHLHGLVTYDVNYLSQII